MNTIKCAVSLSLLAAACAAGAKDHPAVEAAKQTPSYDYASKMYRHPAGLSLLAEAPRELGQHPAILARKKATETAATLQVAYHPALLAQSPCRLAMGQTVEPGLLHSVSSAPAR